MNNDIYKKQRLASLIGSWEMKMTKHAKVRKRQRGFSKFVLDIILKYGSYKYAPGGAIKVHFGNKESQNIITEFKRAMQLIDKAKGCSIIIAEDKIITLYKG